MSSQIASLIPLGLIAVAMVGTQLVAILRDTRGRSGSDRARGGGGARGVGGARGAGGTSGG